MRPAILTLNGGSATLKVGLFCASDRSVRLGEAMLERFAEGPIMRLRAPGLDDAVTQWAKGEGPRDAGAGFAFAWPAIKARHRDLDIVAVGHRIVHGGRDHAGPCVLNQTVLAALDQLSSLAPLHQPVNLAVVAAAQLALPKAVHVACFESCDACFRNDYFFVGFQTELAICNRRKIFQRYEF